MELCRGAWVCPCVKSRLSYRGPREQHGPGPRSTPEGLTCCVDSVISRGMLKSQPALVPWSACELAVFLLQEDLVRPSWPRCLHQVPRAASDQWALGEHLLDRRMLVTAGFKRAWPQLVQTMCRVVKKGWSAVWKMNCSISVCTGRALLSKALSLFCKLLLSPDCSSSPPSTWPDFTCTDCL